jgi:hypothetical protein
MNKDFPLLSIFSLSQTLLNPAARALELPEQILIIYIINLDVEMLVFSPVFKILEIIFQDRDDVRDSSVGQRGLAA